MKRITLTIIIALLLVAILTSGCHTTGGSEETKRDPEVVQEEFNQEATYFIQNDGPKLIEYMDKDQTLSLRDKQPTKRRLRNLNNLIQEMKVEE